jgi:D-sedoheptulose 7-phosphate isomerase
MSESTGARPGTVEEQIAEMERVVAGVALAKEEILRVATILFDHIEAGGKVITCGNGGSALEAQHFAAELISHFRRDRRSVPAVSLPLDYGVITSIANDFSFEEIFSRQVEALAAPGDVVVGISTSGNSANVVAALRAAKSQGALTVALSGRNPGAMGSVADYCLRVDASDTPRVQEGHLMIVHLICEELDERLAG